MAKYIASYAIVTLKGKIDALVFTGGIGENSFYKVGLIYIKYKRKTKFVVTFLSSVVSFLAYIYISCFYHAA